MMEKTKSKSSPSKDTKNKLDDQLLDNIESDDDYLSVEERESSNKSPLKEDKQHEASISKEIDRSSKERRSEHCKDSHSEGSDREKSTKKSHRDYHAKEYRREHRRDDHRDYDKPYREHRKNYRKERYSDDNYRYSKDRLPRNRRAPEVDEEKQIKEAVEDEFLEIKVTVNEQQKGKKSASIKPDAENRVSMESGEIVDDDDDEDLEELRKAISLRKRIKSPSFASSIDSFGRQRRRRRRSESSFSNRSSGNSFSSLDEILKEAEEEEENTGKSFKGQHDKAHSKHHSHHHRKSKKQHTSRSEDENV